MIAKRELVAWLELLPDDAEIGIDDGGLILQMDKSAEYLEVGGLPEAE